jgi:hypothetical protein
VRLVELGRFAVLTSSPFMSKGVACLAHSARSHCGRPGADVSVCCNGPRSGKSGWSQDPALEQPQRPSSQAQFPVGAC